MYLKISDAANLGIHSLVFLAENFQTRRPISTAEAAQALQVSVNHLSKVFQRLTRAGMVRSVRGPKGGFLLSRPPDQITLKDIYEAIDGTMGNQEGCLLGNRACQHQTCLFGTLVHDVEATVAQRFSRSTLAELAARP